MLELPYTKPQRGWSAVYVCSVAAEITALKDTYFVFSIQLVYWLWFVWTDICHTTSQL